MYDPITNIMVDVTRFLTEPVRNRYVSDELGVCMVYARKGIHYINGHMTRTLDVANISVEGGMRGNGIGMSVINSMHAANPYQATYVESLLNEGLHQRLLDDGWLPVAESYPPSVFKPTDNKWPIRNSI